MGDVNLVAIDGVGQLLPITTVDNGDGTRKLVVDLGAAVVTLTPSEIEIGHVAIKNNDTEEHQTVALDGGAVDGTHPNEGALLLAHDDVAAVYRTLKATAAGLLKSVTPNRTDWKVKQIDTGGVIDTPIAGPAQAIPDGFSVLVQADPGNTQAVEVASVGESGAAGTRFTLQPGDVLPITLKVSNMNQIEARSVLGTNEIVNLVAEV